MNRRQQKENYSAGTRLGLLVFSLAVLVRGAYLYDSADNPTFRTPVVDSMTYDVLARDLAEGKPMTQRFFWQQFFYPFFLSVVYFFTGSSIVFVKLLQVVLGAVTCVLTYRLGEKIFGRSAGTLAGLMAALYGPLVFFDCELLAAGWATFWAALLILLFLKTAENKSPLMCVLLGLCGASSVITRPNFIPFFAAASVWLIAVWLRRKAAVKSVALGLLALGAGFAAVTVPVAVQNYRVTGYFSFLPATGGLNLYIGNNPEFEAVSIRPGMEWQRVVDLPLKEGLRIPKEQQRFFYAKTVEYMRTQPMSFLKGLLRKATEFFSSREMPGNINVYLFTRWSRLLGLLTWKADGFGFPFGVLLPLAVLGILLCRRHVPVPLVLFIILYPASVILTHVEARYRMPLVVPLCILAGGGLARIAELVRVRRWRSVMAASLSCIGLGLLCSIAGPFYSEKHIDYEAELFYGLGGSLEKRKRIDEAIQAYSKAAGLRRDYVEAHHNVGLLLMKRQRAPEAVRHLDMALELKPQNSNLHRDLAMGLYMQGRVQDAIRHYYKAIEIDPSNGSAHNHLGLALQSQGRLAEAVKHYRLALQIEPDNADAHYNFGLTLQLEGKFDEAVNQYNEALKFKPDFVNAHSNLGVIFAQRGKLDEAIRHFAAAVRIRPDSAELHYNLAIALQSGGRLNEARDSYRKALAIDPRHEHARQALEKLAE